MTPVKSPWEAKDALAALRDNKLTRLDELSTEIKTHHSLAQKAAGDAVENARLAGGCLVAAKGMVEHGKWLPWLKANCELSPRVAQLYMQLARDLPEDWANTNRGTHLNSLRRVRAMLAAPRAPDAHTEHAPLIPLVHETEETSHVAVPIFRDNDDDGQEPVYLNPVHVFAEPAPQGATTPKSIAALQQVDDILVEAELCLAEAISAIDYPELHQPEKLRAAIEKAQVCMRQAKALSEMAWGTGGSAP